MVFGINGTLAFHEATEIIHGIYSIGIVSKFVNWSCSGVEQLLQADIVTNAIFAANPILHPIRSLKNRIISLETASSLLFSPYTAPVALFLIVGTVIWMRNHHKKRDISLFYRACQKGDVQEVKRLLRKGVPVNGMMDRNLKTKTPLHWAAIKGHAEVVRVLLKHRANPHARDEIEATPFQWACMSSIKTVRALADHSDFGAKDKYQGTCLHWACTNKANPDIVQFLLKRKVDVNAANIDQETPLHFLCTSIMDRQKKMRIAKLLLDSKEILVNPRNRDNETPLDLARNNDKLVELLRKHGATVNLHIISLKMFWSQSQRTIFQNSSNSNTFSTRSQGIVIQEP